jgi:hypothetical protein
MQYLLGCNVNSERWSKDKWHKPATCAKADLNFTMKWLSHAQPFYVGWDWEARRYTRSITSYLDEIGPDERVIAVVHIYTHILTFHHYLFIDRIRKIRRSVDDLLHRNQHAVVAIKGPHTWYIRAK